MLLQVNSGTTCNTHTCIKGPLIIYVSGGGGGGLAKSRGGGSCEFPCG